MPPRSALAQRAGGGRRSQRSRQHEIDRQPLASLVLSVDDDTVFDDDRYVVKHANVARRIAVHRYQVSEQSFRDDASILEVQRDLVYLGGLLAVFLVARGRSIAELLVAVYGAALVTSTFALAHLFFSSPEPDGRRSEPLGYPNALALVAAIGALLATAFAAHARSEPARALSAGSLGLFALTIFFTFSRGTWIALAVGLAAMLALDPRRDVGAQIATRYTRRMPIDRDSSTMPEL